MYKSINPALNSDISSSKQKTFRTTLKRSKVSTFILIGSIIIVASCSTIQKLEDKSYSRSNVNLIPLQTSIEVVDNSLEDPKVRKKNKLTPDILLHFPQESWSKVSSLEKVYFQREIFQRLPKLIARIHLSNSKNESLELTEEEIRALSIEKNIDGILIVKPDLSFTKSSTDQFQKLEQEFVFSVHLKDPYLNSEYFTSQLRWKIPQPLFDNLVFWSEDDSIQFPNHHRMTPVMVLFPTNEDWNNAFIKTIYGTLNIFASSSDTSIRLNGEYIGNTPIRNREAINGINRIEFSRPGFTPVIRSVQVRAGRGSNTIHEWDGDKVVSSVQIQSFPQGLEVWMDSIFKGSTNYYESELLPGDRRIRIVRSIKGLNGSVDNYLYAEGVGNLTDKALNRFALPYNMEEALKPENSEFWNPVGYSGFQPVFNPILSFNKLTSVMLPGDYGFISSYIFPMDLELEGRYEELSKEDGNFMVILLGDDKSLGLESYGEDIALFEWDSKTKTRFKSLGVWKFKKDVKPEEKIFKISIERNPEKPLLKIRLGNREIYKSVPPKGEFYRIGMLTQGEKFRVGSGLKEMKIRYPSLIEWEKSQGVKK